jgi:hypothetical protein
MGREAGATITWPTQRICTPIFAWTSIPIQEADATQRIQVADATQRIQEATLPHKPTRTLNIL